MVGYIYSYTCNKKDSKYYGWVYVGQTRNKIGLMERHRQHLTKSQGKSFFDSVIQKLGEDVFDLKIEMEIVCDTEKELVKELNWHERNFIILYGSFVELGQGFNLTTGGDSCVVSEETKKKKSKSLKKVYSSPEARKKQSERSTKMWQNEDHQKKVSEAMKKICSTPEARKRKSETMKKRYSDPAERRKQSEHFKKMWQNPEYREHIRQKQIERYKDPENRKKVSEANKKRFKDPAERRKQSEIAIKMWQNEEFKQKMSDAIKKALSNPDVIKRKSESMKGKNIKPCQILDIETGFYFQFCSCKEAQKFIGMSKNKLSLYTVNPYKKRYLFIPD